MLKNLAVVMDPISSIHPEKDTTLALLRAAQRYGYRLYYLQTHDLFLDHGKPQAKAQLLEVFDHSEEYFHLHNALLLDLDAMDIILMRKDPPVDQQYIYATWVLSHCQRALVVNNPQALRDCNEKVFATRFPELCPLNLVSSNISDLKAFYRRYGDVIVKPLDGMGGKGIFHLNSDELNVNAILEMLTNTGSVPVMIQIFIPEISAGDKRILLLYGEPVPWALARIPTGDDKVRGNLAAGGVGKVVPLQERDYFICNRLKDTLKKRGIFFAGIDVIGDYLTEINITSPTCMQEISRATGMDIAGQFFTMLEKCS